MKKNALSLAVATSVAALTMASAQAAMYQNTNGTGEVLLFPFYDAENGNSTNMHVVNTTGEVKAVKVRFLEYKSSYEVLDFNLYLSPYDHFAFGVIMDPNGTGGAIITSDNSCTIPALGTQNGDFTGTTATGPNGETVRTQPFVNYEFLKSDIANVPTPFVDSDVARTLRGHVEIIEMGVVADGAITNNPPLATELATQYAAFATHDAAGMPANCGGLVKAFASGAWKADPSTQVSAPTGGLYGLAYHINVEDAAAWGFEPAAIADWSNAEVHSTPGDYQPSLGTTAELQSIVLVDGASKVVTWGDSDDAVSSLFMTPTITNDVQLNAAIGGQTDWVTTFPTKRQYVTNDYGPYGAVAKAPFTGTYTGVRYNLAETALIEVRACEPASTQPWDREEQTLGGAGLSFSPLPPGVQGATICDEQHVAAYGTGATSALNVERDLQTVGFPYTEGWARMSFSHTKEQNLCGTEGNATFCLTGLPAMGFAAYSYANGSSGAVMMNYGHAAEHKTATVTSTTLPTYPSES